MPTALVVVDVQNDFGEGGALPCKGARGLAVNIADYLEAEGDSYEILVATLDWHIAPGDIHWSASPDYVDSWPIHCVADSPGAELITPLEPEDFDFMMRKGLIAPAYSGFEGSTEDGNLNALLVKRGITHVEICGLALDYCVKATALSSVKLGFDTTVWVPLTRSVNPANDAAVLAELESAGVKLALFMPVDSF